MCAISGCINKRRDSAWFELQKQKSLTRGKEFIELSVTGGYLTHARMATNNSTDSYPIELDGELFAMNGMVSEHRYHELQQQYPNLPYTVDSAYLLRLLQEQGFAALDSLDFVFAFWWVRSDTLVLANKDFPLFYEYNGGALRFSSFVESNFVALGSRAIAYDLRDHTINELYKFKNFVYDYEN